MFSRVISFRFSFVLLLSCFVLLAACGQTSSPTTGTNPSPSPTPTAALDVYGTPIVFPKTAPQRIVSLVPSTSEILGALRLQSRVVGVDYYTDYPPDLASLPKVSNADGNFNIEKIVAISPDLWLSWAADTNQNDQQLKNLGLRVIDLPFTTLSGVVQQIVIIGELAVPENTAIVLRHQRQQPLNQLQ